MFLHQSTEKTIEHALAPATITKSQGQYISSRVQKHLLPMLGVVSTFPIWMRHVPFHFGGLGIHQPYHERGRQQLEALLLYQRERSQTSMLMEDSIEQLQLQVGCCGTFWTKPYAKWGKLAPRCWVSSLWEYVYENEITLRVDGLTSLTGQRIHDRCLMSIAMEIYGSRNVLCRINRVRIYLEVYWLSDIATGDGERVEECCVEGSKVRARRSKYTWMKEQPSFSDKVQWVEFVQH